MSATLRSTILNWAVKGTAVHWTVEAHGFDVPAVSPNYLDDGGAQGWLWDVVGLPDGLTATPEEANYGVGEFALDTVADTLTRVAHGLQPRDLVNVFETTGSGDLGTFYVITSGFTTDVIKVSATVGGAPYNFTTGTLARVSMYISATGVAGAIGAQYRLKIEGTPTTAGIYPFTVTCRGFAAGVLTTKTVTGTIVVEGSIGGTGNLLAFYALDFTLDPVDVRTGSIDVQYDCFSRTFKSGAVDLTQPLNLYLGRTQRIHFMASRNGARTLADALTPSLPTAAPTPLGLIIRPPQQLAAAPFFSLSAPSGSDDLGVTGGSTRPVPYFDVVADSGRLRRLFREVTAPAGAEPASLYLDAVAQWSFTLDGRQLVTPELPVKLWQPQDH